jgi:hypothetical protein
MDVPNHESFLPNLVEAEHAYTEFWTRVQSDPSMDVADALVALNARIQDIFDGKLPPTPTIASK